jgi:hypothetical protein
VKDLKSPPPNAEPWIVWDIGQPTNFCTVTARTWITACEQGRLRLGCSRVDAALESEKPLATLGSTRRGDKIHRADACILCNMSPCICSKTNPPPPPVRELSIQEHHQNLYNRFLHTEDLKQKAVCRDKILALIFKKLFDL